MSAVTQEFQEFYARWAPSVLSFCVLFLGDEEQAELATQQAFVEYVRGRQSFTAERLPPTLMRHAVTAATQLAPSEPRFPDSEELEEVLGLLAATERTVFILRTVLELPVSDVAYVLRMSTEQVNESWLKASLFLRDTWMKKR